MMGGGKKKIAAEKLSGISIQTSCYGDAIPVVYGQARVTPNLIYYNDFDAIEHDESQSSGKAGGSNTTNVSYTYQATVLFALCEGQVTINSNSKAWHDKEIGTLGGYGFTVFDGALAQAPWTFLQSAHPSDALAYSGTAMIGMAPMQLSSTGSIGNYSVEVTGLYSIATGTPGSPDANPADIVQDMLTNVYYGMNWPRDNIGDLTAFRTYCTAMGLWLSPVFDEEKPGLEHLSDILECTNSDAVTTAGVIRIVPYGDVAVANNGASYQPNITPLYDLGVSDFVVTDPADDPVQVQRADPADTFNTIPLEFTDRALDYNTNKVQESEPVDADANGIRKAPQETLNHIKVQSVASTVSRIMAQRSCYVRNQYTFNLGWRYCRLEPMDPVTLTDPKSGLDRQLVRIKSMKEETGNDSMPGYFVYIAEDILAGVAHAAQYATQGTSSAVVNELVSPGDVSAPAIFDYPTYLTSTGGAAIGIAVTGGADWGGCQVWISDDNSSYEYAGTIRKGGRYGVTTTALLRTFTATKNTGSTGWDTSPYVNVAMSSGSIRAAAADAVNDIMVGFATGTPVSGGSYTQVVAAYFGAGTLDIYNLGTPVGTYGAYAVGDTVETRYDGAQFTFYHNGVQFGPAIAHTGNVYPMVALYQVGATVLDVEVSPDQPASAWSVPSNASVTADNSVYDTDQVLGVDLTTSGGTLGSIPAAYNADFANLALLENELLSFQTASLTATSKYNLSDLYRGALGSDVTSHPVGARFVRMDDKVLEIPITPARIGKQLYLKFLSFNVFGKSLQQLSDVSPSTFTPSPGWQISNASTGFSASGTVNGVAFFWGSNLLPGAYVVELWQGAVATALSDGSATKVWEGNATGKLLPFADKTTRYFWIKPRAADGRYGPTQPIGNGLPAAAAVVTSNMTLQANPGSATVSGNAKNLTTNTVSVTPAGGTAPYTYAWSWHTGGSGITINAPSSSTTSFSNSTALALNETRTGTAQCLVTDNLGATALVFVNVQITEQTSTVSASASPSSVSSSGTAASQTTPSTTASGSGGLGPYTYSWSWQSGGTGITINSPSSATTSFTDGALSQGQAVSGVAQCVITDQFGQTAVCTVSISLSRVTGVTAYASPSSESVSGSASPLTTGTTTIVASGGSGYYSYSWAWISGGAGIGINLGGSPAGQQVSFSGSPGGGNTLSGTARCTVTDGYGQTATADVTVSIQQLVTQWDFTVTAGSVGYQGGYQAGAFGSGTGLTNGSLTITACEFNAYYGNSVLTIAGFGSDPGSGYFSSLTVGGTSYTSASATYSFSGNTATWTWNGVLFNFNGTPTNCSVNY